LGWYDFNASRKLAACLGPKSSDGLNPNVLGAILATLTPDLFNQFCIELVVTESSQSNPR